MRLLHSWVTKDHPKDLKMMNWKEDELWDAVTRKDLNGVRTALKKVYVHLFLDADDLFCLCLVKCLVLATSGLSCNVPVAGHR